MNTWLIGVRRTGSTSCLILVMLLSACVTSGSRGRVDSLETAINQYGQALRWARYDDAVAFHVATDGSTPSIDLHKLDEVRVTSYDIIERNIDEDMTAATVKGEFSYYLTNRGTVRKLTVEQQWWFDEKLKAWFLGSEFPEFR